ncbi:MAG: PIN domain-containing protein [Chloroflexi bacterium]|nr:PIN domain-containing protein [Chloroflexota bacterium]
MPTAFADAGFWIALLDDEDPLNARATELTVRQPPLSIVTSEMVLVEVFNHFSRSGAQGRLAVNSFVEKLIAADEVEVVQQSSEQFRMAAKRYADRPDQRWSLTDCASFLFMETQGIEQALAYDRDFIQAGFNALLRDESDSGQ